MSGFSADWLALREPLDLAARNATVEKVFFEKLPHQGVCLLDLASGAGSTVAALEHRLPKETRWLLTDYDPDLLKVASARWQGIATGHLSFQQVDLSRDLERLPFKDVHAVTTSAFLDLVSEAFLQRLVSCVVAARIPFLASLSYDGRAAFSPAHAFDGALNAALNADQLNDKGFGSSLGPQAAATAMRLFADNGYRIVEGTSDWAAGPASNAFLRAFLEGWVALGMRSGLDRRQLADWWDARKTQIDTDMLSVSIGHIDFLALPE